MIRICILGDIGSGKSYVANNFGHPVFNADEEVSKLYKGNKNIYNKFKKILPQYFTTFPINKIKVSEAILDNKKNLNKIIKIIHVEVQKKMKEFLNKNKNKEFVILDIPLLLENKINKKKDVLVFIQSKKRDITNRLKKRRNFNHKLIKKFSNIQLPLDYKRKKSDYIIKNDFTKKTISINIKSILKKLQNERNSS